MQQAICHRLLITKIAIVIAAILANFPSCSKSEQIVGDTDNVVQIDRDTMPLDAGRFYTLSSNPDDVQFYYFSNPNDVNDAAEIVYNDISSLQDSGFIAGRRTVFIVHGFHVDFTSDMPRILKNAFLKANAKLGFDYNIIVVNWGPLSTPLPLYLAMSLYNQVTFNVPIVSKRLAEFVLFLRDQNVLSLSKVYLIGHSLGSHVSGLAGLDIFTATGEKISRITGLDPAGPNYFPAMESRGLVKEDALFVDAIHTNAGILGDLTDNGHVDFFPNGGSVQPGCDDEGDTSINIGHCSHAYSYQLYAASLSKTFPACPCDSVRLMYPLGLCPTTCDDSVTLGYHCPPTAMGEYYLETTNPP